MALLLIGCSAGRAPLDRVYEHRFMLSGSQTESVAILVRSGVYRVLLVEEAVDARLHIVDPKLEAEGTLRRYGRQSLVLSVPSPRQLRVEVQGRDVRNKQGHVTLALDLLSEQPAAETARIRSERLLSDAFQKMASGVPQDVRAAEGGLQEAAATLRQQRLDEEGSRAELELARLRYAHLDDWAGAAAAAASVAARARSNDDAILAARANVVQAAALMERAQSAEEAPRLLGNAESLFNSACRVFEAHALALELAECVNNLGLLDDYRGKYAAASATYEKAARLFAAAGDPAGEVKSRQNMATVEYLSGHLSAAIENYEKVLPLIDARVQTDLYAAVVNNLASASAVRGDFQRSIQLHGDSLAIYEQLGRELDAAKALYGLGATYYLAGDAERALSFFERSLPISKAKDNARIVRATLQAMGNALSDLGRYPEALERQRESLQFATTPSAQALAALAIAQIESEMGDVRSAYARLREQLAVITDPVIRARIDALLAGLSLRAGRVSEAVAGALSAAQALERFELGAYAADAYATAAEAQLKSGQPDLALQTLAQATGIARERNRRIWSPDLRASNAASHRRMQDLQLAALMAAAGGADTAPAAAWRSFWVADSFKARSLLQQRESVAAESTQRLNARGEAELRLSELQLRVEAVASGSGAQDPRVTALLDEIRKLRVQRDTAPTGWRAVSLQGAGSDEALRTQLSALLPANGTVLAYHLARPRSYAWIINRDQMTQVDLPAREVIAAAVKPWITALHGTANQPMDADRCGARLAQLIIRPVAPLLRGDRLWIVPDAELNGVPFAALAASGDGTCDDRLVERFTLAYLPSVRFALSAAKTPGAASAEKRIAILAGALDADQIPNRAPVLPATRAETRAISASLTTWPQLILTGAQATRATLLALPFDRLAVLHLATHAQVRAATPELSALYLSSVDAGNRPVPSQVTVADIRRYRVRADLVVLSACETSLGRTVDGEGAIGLTHAFLGAGAHAVVATDWRVGDRATADLMASFYRALGTGSNSAAALTAAQRDALTRAGSMRVLDEWAAFRIVEGFVALL